MNRPSGEYLQDSTLRKVFGKAIANNPEELYAAVTSYPDKESFAAEIVHHLVPQIQRLYPKQEDNPPFGFLNAGIIDAQTIWDGALEDAADVSREQALSIVHHPLTTFVVAHLAGHSQNRLNKFSEDPNREDIFHISSDRRKLILGKRHPNYRDDEMGCPFGGHIDQMHNPSNLDPLFARFAPWAGSLAVYHYYDHLERPATEAPSNHAVA